MERLDNYISGELRPPCDGEYLDVLEPATGAPWARAASSGPEDVDLAVRAAAEAAPNWAAAPARERSLLLLAVADSIERNADAWAELESRDTGKPVALARRVDIPRAVQNFRFFATAILHTESQAHHTDREALNYTLRHPVGVVGLISPWNLPIYLLSWKVAPALATGNAAVAKPSEITPGTGDLLARTCIEVGLPPGVLNIVHGTGPGAGAPLVAHPGIEAISFTGSTRTGAEIARSAAPRFAKLALEMGGKNPNIVFADANMDEAVAGSLRAAFANQGQICLCGSRIYVEAAAYDAFVERFVRAASELIVGDPRDPGTDQGALVSGEHRAKVEAYVELAREEGGRVLLGGRRASDLPERCRDGFFFAPTVIADLPPECRVNQEEIFGPVVTVSPFANESEVIAAANGTAYGLSASVWTESLTRAHRVAGALEAGTVWVNCWLLRDLRVPFGGVKSSGVGREGGREALDFFTEPKNVCVKLGDVTSASPGAAS